MKTIKLWLIDCFYRFFGWTFTFHKCGHKGKKKTWIEVEPGVGGLYEVEEMDYCPKCWLDGAARCAWCGQLILPGHPVTLYTPKPDFEIPNHARSVCDMGGHRLKLVGCARISCADTGADYAGTWEIPNKVVNRRTGYEVITGEPVILER